MLKLFGRGAFGVCSEVFLTLKAKRVILRNMIDELSDHLLKVVLFLVATKKTGSLII